jgi:hypothetical protein
MMNAPVISPSSTISASVKCRPSAPMAAPSRLAWSAARRSAKSSAAASRGVRGAVPPSFGSSSS